MSSNIKQGFETSTAITCQLAPSGTGLASSILAGRESAMVDNTTGNDRDAILTLAIKLNASTAPTGDIYVAVKSSGDGTIVGTPFTASDAAIALARDPQWDGLRIGDPIPGTGAHYLGKLECYGHAAGDTVKNIFESVARAFGGILPSSWGFAIFNRTGSALDTTEANHTKSYRGIYDTAS